MSYEYKKLEKSQAEFVITVKPLDYAKDLEKAAVRLSERAAIKGFRPGKAPYEMVKQQLGELKILEEALQTIVAHAFFEAVQAEKLMTIGQPDIVIEKLAPGNDLVFKATAALLPKITLPNLTEIKIEKKKVEVGDKEVNDVLDNLKKMQPKEVIKKGAATKEDKMVIAMEMFLDKVPVEGGQAPNHQVYLSEPHYIPGLAEQLVGLKSGETKEFNLKFPADHYQKHIAGKSIDFKIKVKDVFTLEYPEVNDDFAIALGQESVEKLKALLLANLTREAENKEARRTEESILEQLIEKTQFEELPDILVTAEKRKMFYELKGDLERQGMSFEKYLADIKKTEEQIFVDFTEGANKRAKAALISRQVAKDNDIKVEKAELDAEIEMIKKSYENDEKVLENLQRPEVIETIAATVQNRKVIEFLRSKIAE